MIDSWWPDIISEYINYNAASWLQCCWCVSGDQCYMRSPHNVVDVFQVTNATCGHLTMLFMCFRWPMPHAVTSVRTATCWTWQHQTITSGTWWSQVTDGFTLYGVWLWNRGMWSSTNNIEPMHMINGYSLNTTAHHCCEIGVCDSVP